jgi:hypothetical protein
VTIDRAAGRGRAAAARQALTLPLLLVVEVAAVLGLHRLGRIPALRIPWDDFGRHLGPWLAQSPVEQVLGAVLRNIALVAAWWLLASTGLYLLASLARAPALIRGAARVTLPAVRRAADGAVAVALATSLLSATTTTAAATPTVRSGPPTPVRAAVAARGPAALQAGPTTTTRQEPAKAGYTPGAAGLGQPASTTTSTPAPSSTTAPRQPTPQTAAPGYTPGAAGLGQQTTTTTSTSPTTTSPTTTSPTTTSPTTTSSTRPPAPSASTGAPTTADGATTTTADTTTTTKPAAPPPSGGAPATTGPRRPAYVPGTAGAPSAPRQPGPAPGQQTPSGRHEVERGENLWEISRNHLASVTGRDPAELGTREVAVYWLRVVVANRVRLRSGNPDLIYRGEFVRLPAVRRPS